MASETIADIVAEMRHGFDQSWHDIDREWAHGLADRIEAAWKRDAAIHAMTCEANERLREHLEIALESDKRTVGNAAAMYEALVKCADIINKFGLAEIVNTPMEVICDIEGIINAALAKPPRNCDVPHKDGHELWVRWQNYCAEIFPSRVSFSTWLLAPAKNGGEK